MKKKSNLENSTKKTVPANAAVPTTYAQPSYVNNLWERWGVWAFVLALILLCLGLLIQAIEIARISAGLYNYGLKNMDFNQHPNYPVVGVNNGYFLYAEPWHFWPWTYAGLIFGMLVVITGLAGLLAALRRSYSLLFTFFAFSLLTCLESIFMIIYYSIILNYYHRYETNLVPGALISDSARRPDAGDRSIGLVGTNLALSIVTLLISLWTMFYAACAGRICTERKSFSSFHRQPKYTAHPTVPAAAAVPPIQTAY